MEKEGEIEQDEGGWELGKGRFAILDRVVRADLIEKMIFE